MIRLRSSTTKPRWRFSSPGTAVVLDERHVDELVAHIDESVAFALPRSVKSKICAYQASASSISPTSIATWLMPIRRVYFLRPWSSPSLHEIAVPH